MRLNGIRALVTGASSGIGRATALELARAGCELMVTGRDAARLDDLARRTGGRPVPADLSTDTGIDRLLDAAAGAAPRVVVHCAGVGLFGGLTEATDADVDRLVAVNVTAPIRLTRALAPVLAGAGGGHFVFVTSIAGRLGVPQEAVYAATKAALHAYADSIRGELAVDRIGVTTVVPGVVATPFFDRRGVPYQRRWPRPIPASRVARATVRAVQRDRPTVVVPGWLRVPIALHATLPRVYAHLSP